MLTFCMVTTNFGMGSDIYRHRKGLAMGSPLSPVLANIYMEYFEKMALGSTSLKPSMWLRYADDIHSLASSGRRSDVTWSPELNQTIYTVNYGEIMTFILWPHQEDVQMLLDHLNSIRPSIQLIMEKEQDNNLPFLDVLVTRTEQAFRLSVYSKPTFTGQYPNFNSHHPYTVKKKGIVRCLQHRAKIITSDTDAYQEMISLRQSPS